MKLLKAILTVLIIGILALLSLFLYAQTNVAYAMAVASTEPDLETKALTFVNLLVEGKFEDAVKLFNTKMVEALPPKRLKETWNGLIEKVGEFKNVTDTRIVEEKGYRVVYVTCEFVKTSLNIKVVFDEEGKIAGLWFVPAKIEGLAGIYVAAILATVISVLLWGGLVYWFSKRQSKYLVLMLITLPLSTIVNLWVKKPIYEFLLTSFNISPELSIATPLWFILLVLFIPPFTEEAIKLSPLVAKKVRKMINMSSALWIGMAFGMGFGIGEIWYLSWRISMLPEYAGYPFYYFLGFINERTICVFFHGVMTAVVVTSFVKGGKGLLIGYFGAVFLHAFVNIGAMLYQIKFWDVTFASLYLILSILVAIFIFERMRKKVLKGQERVEIVLFSRN